jgi:hypothetical protein
MAIEIRQLTVTSNVASTEPRQRVQFPEPERERMKQEMLRECREAMVERLRLERER